MLHTITRRWRLMLVTLLVALVGAVAPVANGSKAVAASPVPNSTYTPQVAGPWVDIYNPTKPEGGGYINDHTVIKGGDGLWHVFGISGLTGNSLAAASGPSLKSATGWTEQDPIAAYNDASGSPLVALAPYAMKVGSTYYLFYFTNSLLANGNKDPDTVRDPTLAVLTSTDPHLATWTKQSTTVTGLKPYFRDPMVLPYGSGYLLYAPAVDSSTGANYLARYTSTDLLNWTYSGKALTVSGTAPTANAGSTESPFVFKYGDYYYLSSTINSYGPTTYNNTDIIRSADPTDFGDFTGTSVTGAGTFVEALTVHAPEYVQDGSQTYITTVGNTGADPYNEAQHGLAIAPLNFVNPAGEAPPSNGLVRDYQFQDVVTDSSSNHRDGQLTGDASYAAAGHTGQGLSMVSDGTAQVPGNLSFTGDFTVAAWIKTTSSPTNANGLVRADGVCCAVPGGGYNIDINLADGFPRLFAGSNIAVSSTAVAANTWAHVAVSRSGSAITTYVNGIATGSGTWSGPFVPAAIGSTLAGTAPETIDDFVLYNRALSSSEVNNLASSGPSIPAAGLQLDYSFEDPSRLVIDNAGNGNRARLQGAAVLTSGGHTGGALSTGADLYGYLNAPSGLALSSDFTVAGWIKTTATPSNANGLFAGAAQDINLYQARPRFYAGSDLVTSSTTVASNTWNHVALTRSGSMLTIYVNGMSAGTGTWNGTLAPSMIGRSLLGGGAQLTDDLVFYSRALSSADISGLASSSPVTPTTGLIADYTFDQPNGTYVVDGSSTHSDAIATAGTTNLTQFGFAGGGIQLNQGGAGTIPVSGLSLTGDFTIAAWVEPQTTVDNSSGLFRGSGQDLNFDKGFPTFYTGTNVLVSNVAVPQGLWTHVALTRSGSSVTLYVNGVLAATGTYSGTVAPTSFGATVAGSNAEVLDNVLVYNRALSTTEVANLN